MAFICGICSVKLLQAIRPFIQSQFRPLAVNLLNKDLSYHTTVHCPERAARKVAPVLVSLVKGLDINLGSLLCLLE